MQKDKREVSKNIKKIRKNRRKARRLGVGQIRVTVAMNCGCCYEELVFNSKESADAAFKKAGLDLNATITDDQGKTVKDVDTFYGYSITKDEIDELKNQPLMRLAKLAGLIDDRPKKGKRK